jgi:hypothetical protein
MWALYEEYEREMMLLDAFRSADIFLKLNPTLAPGQAALSNVPKMVSVMIESRERCDALTSDLQIYGEKNAAGSVGTQVYVNRLGWERIR